MKNQSLALALSTILGVGALIAAPQAQEQAPAQQSARPAARHQVDPSRQVQRLTKKLNLTADQQNQILPILTDRQQQIGSVMNDTSLSPKDRHEKMRAIHDDTDGKINAILTNEQKQSYAQMEQQMRDRARDRRQQSGGVNQ